MCKKDEITLFRAGISNPTMIGDILKYGSLEDNALKTVLADVGRIHKETKEIQDLSIYEELTEHDAAEALLAPLVWNDAGKEKLYEILKQRSEDRAFTKIVVENIKDPERITTLLKACVFERPPEITNRTTIGSPGDIQALGKRMKTKVEEFISTGFNNIDAVLSGGWAKKNLFCFLGLIGTGKSIWLCILAAMAWLSGKKVLYISTEMDSDEISDRVFRGAFDSESLQESALRSQKKYPEEALFTAIKYEPRSTDCNMIQEQIESLGWVPDICFVDYMDELLPTTSKNGEDYQTQGIITADLKTLAERFNMPVITATQGNRKMAGSNGGTKKYVSIDDTADSMKKLRNLQSLFIIKQTIQEKAAGIMCLKVAKNRFGPTPSDFLKFRINYLTMCISEYFEDEEDDDPDDIDVPQSNAPKLNKKGKLS